jgi:hypothetical protein
MLLSSIKKKQIRDGTIGAIAKRILEMLDILKSTLNKTAIKTGKESDAIVRSPPSLVPFSAWTG